MAARHRGKYMNSTSHMYDGFKPMYDPDEDEEDDEDEAQECVTWCGNPMYPACMDSCKLWDD